MVTIIFEAHATTYDNEKKIASGHFDAELSPTGVLRAHELGTRRQHEHFDAIFCSDLQRSYKTAELAFGNKFPIFIDARLRECHYGAFQHKPSAFIETERIMRIDTPFPGGESYSQRADMMRTFLKELIQNFNDKRVLIVGHRATQYGIERWVTGRPLAEIAAKQWQRQPGWEYHLTKILV